MVTALIDDCHGGNCGYRKFGSIVSSAGGIATRMKDRPRQLLETLRVLFGSCQSFDTRSYEDSASAEAIFQKLVPAIQGELEGALSLISLILAYYEPLVQTKSESQLLAEGEDGDSRGSNPTADLTDLLFIARIELMQQGERLGSLQDDTDPWEAISICAATRRRILKLSTVIDKDICAIEGEAQEEAPYPSELERSLLVRRVYGRFRKAIVQGPSPDKESIESRMAMAAREIEVIVNGEVYQDMRVEDRRQFRTFSVQIEDWLAMGESFNEFEGITIFQEVVNFSQLLMQVNNRGDLQEYDSRVLVEIHTELFCKDEVPTEISPDVLERLKSLYGRDDELDHLMDYVEESPPVFWKNPLERIISNSSQPTETAESTGFDRQTAPRF